MSAPLVLSVDLTDTAMLDRVWPILSNLEVIAVNQHWAGSPGQLLLTDASVFPSKLSASGYYSYPGTLGQCDTSATFPSHPLHSHFTRGPLMVMVMVNAAMLQCCNAAMVMVMVMVMVQWHIPSQCPLSQGCAHCCRILC